MKKALTTLLMCSMLVFVPVSAYASSLDDVIGGQESSEQSSEDEQAPAEQTSGDTTVGTDPTGPSADQYLTDLQNASRLNIDASGNTKAQSAIRKVASKIVAIVSYFLVAFLAVRVVLDLVYIALPFTRSFLSNGYGGNAAAGGGGMGMQQPGMGGMGMGGMGMGAGMGGMGMGGMGMGRMGMGRMGMGGMGAGMGAGGQMGANPAMGRVQWVSNAALNAVAAEAMPGPDGKPQSAFKMYAKDMIVVLVVTPILLTLAVTGVLSNLGFFLGDLIGRGIESLSHSF